MKDGDGRLWVRLDAGIPSHDKTLLLLQNRKGLEALAVYALGLAWSGASGTEGHIPRFALPSIHATKAHVDLLVSVRFWEPTPTGDGWIIRNWERRQPSIEELRRQKADRRRSGRRANCVRWRHEEGCRCWADDP